MYIYYKLLNMLVPTLTPFTNTGIFHQVYDCIPSDHTWGVTVRCVRCILHTAGRENHLCESRRANKSVLSAVSSCNKHTQKVCTSVLQRATNLLLWPAGHRQQLQPGHGLGPLLSLALLGLCVGAQSVSPGAGQNQASPAAPAHRRSAELEGRRQELLVLLVRMVLRNTSR